MLGTERLFIHPYISKSDCPLRAAVPVIDLVTAASRKRTSANSGT